MKDKINKDNILDDTASVLYGLSILTLKDCPFEDTEKCGDCIDLLKEYFNCKQNTNEPKGKGELL